jgi:hypothetical protein
MDERVSRHLFLTNFQTYGVYGRKRAARKKCSIRVAVLSNTLDRGGKKAGRAGAVLYAALLNGLPLPTLAELVLTTPREDRCL